MSKLKSLKKLLLAKTETTSGTAQALAKTDAILASDITITPMAGGSVSRDFVRPYFGNSGDIQVNTHQQISFSVELAASGTAGTAPAWGRLLTACGMSETVGKKQVRDRANNKVDYKPITGAEPSLTIGIYLDGQLHSLVGSRGSFSLGLSANEIPKLNFTFTGLWVDPVSANQIADPDYSAFKIPKIGSNANTPTLSFYDKVDLAMSAFSFDYNAQVAHRELIGSKSEVVISDRQPSGSITLDAPKLTALNLIQKAKESTSGALKLVHGGPDADDNAGNLIEINAPKVMLSDLSYQESDGILQIQSNLAFVPDTGNDELIITAR